MEMVLLSNYPIEEYNRIKAAADAAKIKYKIVQSAEDINGNPLAGLWSIYAEPGSIDKFMAAWDNSKRPQDFPECNCNKCFLKCVHNGAYRRLPQSIGGLGLCKNLKK